MMIGGFVRLGRAVRPRHPHRHLPLHRPLSTGDASTGACPAEREVVDLLHGRALERFERGDLSGALFLFHECADRGHVPSLYRLAVLALRGVTRRTDRTSLQPDEGGREGVTLAVELLTRAASKEHVRSAYLLAALLGGTERRLASPNRNREEALRWFRFAASRGHSLAALHLAKLLLSTSTSPTPPTSPTSATEEALKWLSAACEANVADAFYLTAKLVLHDPLVTGETVSGQVPKDEARALLLLRRGSDLGSAEAQARLGEWYFCKQQWDYAYQELSKASNQGHVQAQAKLGALLAHGLGCTADRNEAFTWLATASQAGILDAHLQLFWLARTQNASDPPLLNQQEKFISGLIEKIIANMKSQPEFNLDVQQRLQTNPKLLFDAFNRYHYKHQHPWLSNAHALFSCC